MKVKTRNITRVDQGAEIGDVEVTITMSLDQALSIATLLANVGDHEAGPLVGMYDAIGDAVEYTPKGERTSYSLYDAVNRRQEWARKFIDRSHNYLHSTGR